MTKEMTALAYSCDLGQVTSDKKAGFIMLGYDDIYSIQYFGQTYGGDMSIKHFRVCLSVTGMIRKQPKE